MKDPSLRDPHESHPKDPPSITEPVPAVSVVIPIRNAEAYLPKLLQAILGQQEVEVLEILLLDSMSTDRSAEIAASYDRIRVLQETAFSHGGTRNRGIDLAQSEFVILMTQDALPRDSTCFAHLLAAFKEDQTAYAFSRQVPYPDTNPMECYYLQEKFPEEPSSLFQTGGKGVNSPDQSFCSNVCAALRKSVWTTHRFREDLIMGEDQELSCQLQEAGYNVAYVAESVVVHSHNYHLLTLFRRYFDSVVAITQLFPERPLGKNAGSGVNFLKGELLFLARHHPLWLFYYPFYLGAKTLATLLGHGADSLPARFRLFCSMNRSFWIQKA